MKKLELNDSVYNTLWNILSEVKKTVDTGDLQKNGNICANYENYLLVLDKQEVEDLKWLSVIMGF